MRFRSLGIENVYIINAFEFANKHPGVLGVDMQFPVQQGSEILGGLLLLHGKCIAGLSKRYCHGENVVVERGGIVRARY